MIILLLNNDNGVDGDSSRGGGAFVGISCYNNRKIIVL